MGAMSLISDSILMYLNFDVTLQEVHNLAYFYHWSKQECWETPRTERKVFNYKLRQQLKAESGKSK